MSPESIAPRLAVIDLLSAQDPLSDESCVCLINYREEDDLVDFKETFDSSHDKAWIDLAVDCVAFANTRGGYVVVGVRDKTWDQIGVAEETADALSDIKRILEKVNRSLSPPITRARARIVTFEGRRFAIICIPASQDRTHIFESNLNLTLPGQTPKLMVRQGAVYVRRSGSNQIMTSTDFEELVGRRIDRFKSRILDGISRVVTAQPNQELITVTKNIEEGGAVRYRVVDASGGEGIEGATLTIAGTTLRDRVALFMALSSGGNSYEVDDHLLYEAYASRETEQWSDVQRDWVCERALGAGLPCFYWLRGRSKADCRGFISSAVDRATFINKLHLLNVAGFYGEQFHARIYERLGEVGKERGAKEFRDLRSLFGTAASRNHERDSRRATELAAGLSKQAIRAVKDRYELDRLDCALYAPFND